MGHVVAYVTLRLDPSRGYHAACSASDDEGRMGEAEPIAAEPGIMGDVATLFTLLRARRIHPHPRIRCSTASRRI